MAAFADHPTYTVDVATGWEAARSGWADAFRGGVATPFQCPSFLDAWYGTLGAVPGVEPLILTARDARSGEDAVRLALVRRRAGHRRVIGFADSDFSDYNAPILGPAAPRDAAGARLLLRDLLAALPPADVLDLRKMPPEVAGLPNPLALLPHLSSRLNGNLVLTGDVFEDYMRDQLKRTVRKELERSWRVFQRHPEARLVEAGDPKERGLLLEALERLQPERLEATGRASLIGQHAPTQFYRRLVEADPTGERVGLFGLRAGAEIVAVLMGLHSPGRFTMVRIGNSLDPAWTNCSPGRLVIAGTMKHLHAKGVRDFDFSVGNFDYKRRFAVVPTPLVDVVRALSPLGVPARIDAGMRAWLRAHPHIENRVRAALGRRQADAA